MKSFHPLTVETKTNETRDSVRLKLGVPDDVKDEFAFQPGQHLPLQIEKDGRILRRTYSICSPAGHWPLELGIRVQAGGKFSEFAANELQAGDVLQAMPPTGRFHANPDADNEKLYLGVAAGSGITPVLSIMTTLLAEEPGSRFILFYGNRQQNTTMFIDDLYALKNRYPERLSLHFLFSQEEQEFDIASGRLDADKMHELCSRFCTASLPDEAFVCGPDSMIETVSKVLTDLGIPADAVHSERFGVPRKAARAAAGAAVVATDGDKTAKITVVMDGHRKSFDMPQSGTNIVDAAADSGVELPYSCKGGVCATCRTHVRKGEVRMATNYGLEPWEVEKGFVLACQSTPVSAEVELDYDRT